MAVKTIHGFLIFTEFILIKAYSNPKYTWPLGDTSYAFEVVKGNVPSNEMDQCGFYFADSHPDLSYQALSLDAYQYPFVDLTLSTENSFDKFSFTFLIKPLSLTGCIMNYQHSGSGNHVTMIVVYLDAGKIGVETNYGTAITLSAVLLTTGSWNFISVSKEYDTGKIRVSLGTSLVINLDNSFPNDKRLEIPGTIRIGSTFDNSRPPFQGKITCVNMFDDVFWINEDSSAINECKDSNWSEMPTGLYVRSTAKVIYGREKLRKKEKPGLPSANSPGCPYLLTDSTTQSTTTNPATTSGTTTTTATTSGTTPTIATTSGTTTTTATTSGTTTTTATTSGTTTTTATTSGTTPTIASTSGNTTTTATTSGTTTTTATTSGTTPTIASTSGTTTTTATTSGTTTTKASTSGTTTTTATTSGTTPTIATTSGTTNTTATTSGTTTTTATTLSTTTTTASTSGTTTTTATTSGTTTTSAPDTTTATTSPQIEDETTTNPQQNTTMNENSVCIPLLRDTSYFKRYASSTSIKNEIAQLRSIFKTSIRHCAVTCASLEGCASFTINSDIGSNARTCKLYNVYKAAFTEYSENVTLYVHSECL